jgi:DNA polymerase-3 subunit beta
MHFLIKGSDLVASVAMVEKAIATNAQTPVLEGLHLLVDEKGLKITANNLQMAIQTRTSCVVMETGEHIVNGRLFAELVRKLPAQDVTVEWNDGRILISSGTMEFSLNTITGEAFPEYPYCSERVISLTDYELLRLIRNSSFATSNDDHQPIFSGVLMEVKDRKINFVATDSNRLAFVQAETGTTYVDKGAYIIPKANLVELGRCLPMNETNIQVFSGNNQLAFHFENTIFTTRLIDGRFPNYESVLYTEQKTKVKMKRTQLIQALERAAIVGRVDSAPVLIHVNEGVLEIGTTSRWGRSQEQYNIEQDGPPEQAAYSPKFMLDMLKTMDGDEVEFRFEGTRQALMKVADDDQHLYILMPIRI